MQKAGGIIAIIAGVFSILAALSTLLIGGIGAAVGAEGGGLAVASGWGGIFISFLIIVFGAITISAKTRIPGTLLILTSILGAALGSVLVAICMLLSLIGGILALFGIKKVEQPPAMTSQQVNPAFANAGLGLESDQQQQQLQNQQAAIPLQKAKSNTWKYVLIGFVFLWLFAATVVHFSKLSKESDDEDFTIAANDVDKGSEVVTQAEGKPSPNINKADQASMSASQQSTAKPRELSKLDQLALAEASILSPVGELADIFELGGRYTDLQRENKLAEIKGQIVEWSLRVYDVKKVGKRYKVQTYGGILSDRNIVSTFAYVSPRSADDITLIESLKTDDYINVKGVIKDTLMRHIELKPAIVTSDTNVSQKSAGANTCSALPVLSEQLICMDHGLRALDQELKQYTRQLNAESLEKFSEVESLRRDCLNAMCLQLYFASAKTLAETLISQQATSHTQTAVNQSMTNTRAPKANVLATTQQSNTASAMIKPSFNCAKASTRIEKWICADQQLAKLDNELAVIYKEAKQFYDVALLKDSQRSWLKERNQCADVDCVKRAYQQRINEFDIEISEMKSGI